MWQAIITEDGKYKDLALFGKLRDGFEEVTKDGNNVIYNGQIIDKWIPENTTEEKIQILINEIDVLDTKRIRAIAEPSEYNGDEDFDGTWLEYYTQQIITLRAEIQELKEV